MKILKHGDMKPRKFTCTNCYCEFVADQSEYGTYRYSQGTSPIRYLVACPDCNYDLDVAHYDAPLYEDETIDNVIDSMSDEEVHIYCKMLYKKLTELQGEHDFYT